MIEYIRCTKCPADWKVSVYGQESTIRLALEHAQAHIGPASMGALADVFEPGVNRCRDGVHSMPHMGCILR